MRSTTIPRPTRHGIDHATFHPPPDPLTHGLSVPGLCEYHAKHSPDHPVFTYADHGTGKPHDITFAEVWDILGIVAEVVSSRCSVHSNRLEARTLDGSGERLVIGIFAISDALSYIYTLISLLGLGFTAFPLSTTNNANALAHLLAVKEVKRLFVSTDAEMQSVARGALAILEGKGITLELLPMVVPEDYSNSTSVGRSSEGLRQLVREADDLPAIILHSSGSTGFGDIDLAGRRIAAHTNPIFHATGVVSMTYPLSCGAVFAVYPPVRPLPVPTPSNYLAGWQACKCDIIFCVPVFVEGLARHPAGVAALKSLDLAVYAGAPLAKSIGNMLASEGVRLVSVWGSTEIGIASKMFPGNPKAENWDYIELSPQVELYMRPQEGLDGVFEPIKITTETSFPHVSNAEVDGKPAWALGDLLEQHPTDLKLWKILGRKDDQIVFSTGRMLNPVSIEKLLAEDPMIRAAVIFGHGHIRPGVLIEPAHEHSVKDVKAAIWPAVQNANAHLDRHAWIQSNMILLASPEKPLQRTMKGNVRRGVCLELYKEEIEALYLAVLAQSDESPENRAFRERM
ncbi:acetyl-CoA synthetase-like protein [Trametes polyzona]|nr:acetyl-CoA synthetase-like protein [Trametes polyzona]